MFWKKKTKLPVTPQDQIWVEESLSFLKDILGEERLLAVKTVEPSKAFFNRDFDGTEADAQFILEYCQELMDIEKGKVSLEFYSEENRYLDDGTLLSTTADIMGRSYGAAGTYQQKDGKSLIQIAREQLKHTESLIATISHELAHEKLLGEHRIIENDEYLTDLVAIVYGFGIFIANSKFQFQSGMNDGFGWQMQSQGYLPEQVIAYAMASLALKKEEKTFDYTKFFDSAVKKFFEKSLTYLESQSNHSVFWETPKKDKLKVSKSVQQTYDSANLETLQNNMQQACYKGDADTVKKILEMGVSPNFIVIGGSPLSIAVKQNYKALVDCLLNYGADINFSNPENMMDVLPIMAACKNENIAMMQYLLDCGAEIDRVGGNGKSVLEYAVESGDREIVAVLLTAGAKIEIKSGLFLNFDKTPLTAAVMNNDKEMVSFLIDKGAKTKAIRKLNRSDIHPQMVKFLKTKKYL